MTSTVDAEVKEYIRKIALLNAILHDGKAQAQPVLGRLLAEQPDLKTRIREVAPTIAEVIQEVNKLSVEEQRKILEQRWPEVLVKERVEEERKLPPLPNVERYERVVTRFSPNPDCVLHLGSARAIILCYEYARMHNGSFILRFEDTDPKLKKPMLPFYDSIREDMRWLGCRWDAEFIQSDRLPIYYEHAERLLKSGHAYVCVCRPEAFREKVMAKQPCPCRDLTPDDHLVRWNHMLNGTYGEGEAAVRVKTELKHPNPAVRDWPALRIIDTEKYPHPRTGSQYRVWPLYNLACGIDDNLMGVTHIIRGKEHLTNQVRQEYMYEHFGWKYPEAIHYGRMKIAGATLSKSKILQGLKGGVFKHWDDPRLATFAALRRRGITPEAIRRLIIDVGPKPVDVVLSWENLYANNRKIIDPAANRYFFVQNPIQLIVKNIPRVFVAKLPLHPDHPKRGFRQFEIEPIEGEASFWASSDDMKVLETGKVTRFMGLFNIQVEKVEKYLINAIFHSESYEEAKKMSAPLIHWIPVGADIPCEVIMPDASTMEGIAESHCKTLRPNQIIQFERFGFIRVDNLNKKLTAYFAHR
ncbi:MAG: Glutamate--tRNA ligase [Candidatus Bathyarchaeota archaeon BA1]|nr:MAG: Glutamate--tRNA ligase [Candidatus Bathyarchaeota archaeon BA1]